MIKFKSCPRCVQGDLVLGRDLYGRYMQCIQCAHMVDMVAAPVKEELSRQLASLTEPPHERLIYQQGGTHANNFH